MENKDGAKSVGAGDTGGYRLEDRRCVRTCGISLTILLLDLQNDMLHMTMQTIIAETIKFTHNFSMLSDGVKETLRNSSINHMIREDRCR